MTIACKQCAVELEEGVCPRCGAAAAEPAPVAEESSPACASSDNVPRFLIGSDLEGIGGWLILVAVGLGISPLVLMRGVYSGLRIVYSAQFQAGLAYRPGLAALVLFEAVSNTIFLLGLIALNILFYGKKKAFPGWMIAYLGIHCAVILIDHVAALHFNSHAGTVAAINSVVGTLIWIPYYLRSERVKATFVR